MTRPYLLPVKHLRLDLAGRDLSEYMTKVQVQVLLIDKMPTVLSMVLQMMYDLSLLFADGGSQAWNMCNDVCLHQVYPVYHIYTHACTPIVTFTAFVRFAPGFA